MTKIKQNFQLKNYNTFGLSAYADSFVKATNIEVLKETLKKNTNQEIFVLGGGSNMLLTQNINKLVIYVNNFGIEIIEENDDFALVKANAGEVWHDLVL